MLKQNRQQYWYENIVGNNLNKVQGRCVADIVLKGRPNTVLDGQIQVQAPATVQRTVNRVKTYQRTGGIGKGLWVKANIKNTGGRATNAYQIPRLIVYLKQRNPEDILAK